MEAWNRFRIPLAVTEVHLHCGREDQLRWLWEIWQQTHMARELGADVRAVTAWSLFGAFDWDSLVTQPRGHYEPGAFDVRGPTPRPTALAALIGELTAGKSPCHPLLMQPGWWRRSIRQGYLPGNSAVSSDAGGEEDFKGPPVLITGANGRLANAFKRICRVRGIPCRLFARSDLDIASSSSVTNALNVVQPWAVINAAGYAHIDEAESNAEQCQRDNVEGPAILAAACLKADIPFVTFSSDQVFDGKQRTPYSESDSVNPPGVYGKAKAECERRVLNSHPDALVVRTSDFFSPWDDYNFVGICRHVLHSRKPCIIPDGVVSPTYLPDLVHACLDLLIDRASGIWHLAGHGEISWADLVEEVACRSGMATSLINVSIRAGNSIAPRPIYCALRSERGPALPGWSDALDRYFTEVAPVFTGVAVGSDCAEVCATGKR